MSNPTRLILFARLGLGVAALALGVLCLGPAGLSEPLGLDGGWARFGLTYLLVGLGFCAFPHSRRGELALAILVFALAIFLVQGWTGRQMRLEDAAMSLGAVLAGLAPSWIETLRRLERGEPAKARGREDRGRRTARPAGERPPHPLAETEFMRNLAAASQLSRTARHGA